MYALFARVAGTWRFEGFTSDEEHRTTGASHEQQRDQFVEAVEDDSGLGNARAFEL